MPKAARLTDVDTGHDLCSPTPVITGSPDVTIERLDAARKGDPLASHGCPAHPSHARAISGGSTTVTINGMPAARIGDAISCGGTLAMGAATVTIG